MMRITSQILRQLEIVGLGMVSKMVMRTPDEVSCALRAGREKGQFDSLGESGRVAGGRIETLYFYLTFATILSPSQSLKAVTSMLDEVSLRSHVDKK